MAGKQSGYRQLRRQGGAATGTAKCHPPGLSRTAGRNRGRHLRGGHTAGCTGFSADLQPACHGHCGLSHLVQNTGDLRGRHKNRGTCITITKKSGKAGYRFFVPNPPGFSFTAS